MSSVIRSDVKMPHMDGLALLRHVKAQASGVVVIMMSGYHDVAAAVEAMKQGAYDFIPKPFEEEELLAALHRGFAELKRLGGYEQPMRPGRRISA